MRTSTAAALTVTLVATGLTPLFLAAPASAAVAKHYDDFNGDGYRDLAYSHYYSGISGDDGWTGGAVNIVYGSASGLDTTRTQVVHQDSPGIPGTGEEDDYFGESISSADLNKDGYADLIAGNGTEHVGSAKYRGTVTIVWGSRTGLSGGTSLAPKSGAGGSQSHFGSELATGDFNGDGSPDLAVIGGGEAWLYRGPFTKSGATGSVSKIDKEGAGWYSHGLAAGKVNGDGRTDLVVLGTQFVDNKPANRIWYLKGASSGLTSGASKTYASEPWGATIGDFDKNGYGDIAVGLPDNNDGKGIVSVWRGTSLGPSGSMTYNQASSGVSGSPEAGDNFGYAVSAGDTNGDGYADLAVGVPQEDVDGKEDQGGVTVFRGGSGGLTGTRSTWIPQTVLGPADSYASFGSPVRLRDLDRDGKADLTVGANGDALLMRGTSTTPTATGAVHLPEYGGGFLD
ncbi:MULTISPECIES: FG-GAP-like repeat-containing protein [unclassified Streptomyces]|uniref:FG-GAP-like repeat-containing protein n=1 Tax=unclassified Streptomyces TaxID=2593676 RepID=UPI00061A034D|nr:MULTISPECIES: FG-GAP-like repeat-containing protein [unclassified Streptomyces]KKD07562.1 mucin [Streptomyces sp. WM6386]KKD15175.1 mucin [Streptomyces sp. WM6391]